MVANVGQICASALTPDQLAHYVRAVSGLETEICGDCLLHQGGGFGVLVAYPREKPEDMRAVEAALVEALKKNLEHITVLACMRPESAPAEAEVKSDQYWSMALPPPQPGQKLRNLLKSAARAIQITTASGKEAWTSEHEGLLENFIARKKLDEGSIHIFRKMADYLANAPDALLFSARNLDNRLVACAIGDYTAFATAFYMFAFRDEKAPPGASDLLLKSIAEEGSKKGHSLLNLGLGIDAGVEFFKKKWGAEPFLPCVETSWTIRRPSFFQRLFAKKSR